MLFHCLTAALLALEAVASPIAPGTGLTKRQVPTSHALHERHAPHWSQKWTKKDKLPANTMLPMRIGLKQSNLDVGHDKLMEMSAPRAPFSGLSLLEVG